MERLGFWGIIKLATHLVLRNLKHFLCITFALSFIVLVPLGHLVLQAFASTSSLLYKISASHGRLDPSDLSPPSEQQHHSLSLLIFLAVFPIFIYYVLFCTLLVTFSVCRAFLNKSVDLKGSARGWPRSSKNLILTWLLQFAVILAFMVVAMLVMGIIAAGLAAVNANVVIPMTVMTMGVVGGGIYMAVAFRLANTVAILEEKKGWEAMRRSMYLIQGSRWVVIGLYGFYGVLNMVPLLVIVSKGASVEASVVWRWGAGALQAFIAVCSMASTVVLFMSCKGGHGEPLDTLVAAGAQFGPRELAPAKYLDLETAALTTTTQ